MDLLEKFFSIVESRRYTAFFHFILWWAKFINSLCSTSKKDGCHTKHDTTSCCVNWQRLI